MAGRPATREGRRLPPRGRRPRETGPEVPVSGGSARFGAGGLTGFRGESEKNRARPRGLHRPGVAYRLSAFAIRSFSAARSGSSRFATRAASTSATMIWPTSSATSEKMPWAFILAVWYRLSSVGLT